MQQQDYPTETSKVVLAATPTGNIKHGLTNKSRKEVKNKKQVPDLNLFVLKLEKEHVFLIDNAFTKKSPRLSPTKGLITKDSISPERQENI